VLDEIEQFLCLYIAWPSEAACVAVTLWVAHTHAIDSFESTPRLALLSPEPASGKTRALEVVDLLVPRSMHALNAAPAAVFRSIGTDSTEPPTLLFDEVDAIFGRRGKDDPAEDLRGLLNAGHRRGAAIPRCVGPKHEVVRFKVFAAVALAGLGDLPETLMQRSVQIRMRRRRPSEGVLPFRHRVVRPEGDRLRQRLGAWVRARASDLRDAWPEMPIGITDRPADVWEPLLAIADAAGGAWPERGRAACVELCRVAETRDASLGITLLTDVRVVFGVDPQLSTHELLARLHDLEEGPWAELRGRPLDARGLAGLLHPYGIASTKIRVGAATPRGYRTVDFFDAWDRYLSIDTPIGGPEHPEHQEQPLRPASDAPDVGSLRSPRSGTLDPHGSGGEVGDLPGSARSTCSTDSGGKGMCTLCGTSSARLIPHHSGVGQYCPACCVVVAEQVTR
jgi:hypothetical protein